MIFEKFEDLDVKPGIKRALKELNLVDMTAVQREVIPYMTFKEDVLALAPTGTGKTFAFGIPVVNGTESDEDKVSTLILCPTRELAVQLDGELRKLTKYMEGVRILAVYGGQPFQRQLSALKRYPQIIVGTTGRVMDHLRRRSIKLDAVRTVILDEADEMLNMGFREDIDTILKETPSTAQVLLFSATMSKEIARISSSYQKDPKTVKVDLDIERPDIKQYYVKLNENQKQDAFEKIFQSEAYNFVLMFCNTRRKVDSLTKQLKLKGYSCEGIHGDLRQRERDAVMKKYRNREINILIATDVAARGIDVKDIEAIFNYDLPENEEYYTHRIGRTGRAKRSGIAYTFATKNDSFRIKSLAKYADSVIEEMVVANLTQVPKKIEATAKKEIKPLFSRYFINLGTMDNLTESKLKQFITVNTQIDVEDIAEVKLHDSYGFVEVLSDKSLNLIVLNGTKYGRRVINIEEATPLRKSKDSSRKSEFYKDKAKSSRFDDSKEDNKEGYKGKSKSSSWKDKSKDDSSYKGDKSKSSSWKDKSKDDSSGYKGDKSKSSNKDKPYQEYKNSSTTRADNKPKSSSKWGGKNQGNTSPKRIGSKEKTYNK